MRPRKQIIRESFEELDELRRYHHGTIEEVKLMFLRMLKEDSTRPIAETTRRVGISERRGRYWWETYCRNGLRGLLERRVWGRGELEKTVPRIQSGHDAKHRRSANGIVPPHHQLIDYPAFVNAVAGISDLENPMEWTRAFGNLFIEQIPEVDYAVISVRITADIDNEGEREEKIVVRQYQDQSGEIKESIEAEEQIHNFEKVLAQGKERGFPFDQYHYPPTGFDFFLRRSKESQSSGKEADPNVCLGSLLLFRNKHLSPFSPETLDLIERLRPFITYVLTSFIARRRRDMPGLEFYSEAIARIAGEANLSNREQIILNLLLIGYSEKKIADSLSISPKTVESHIYSLYRKTGVTKVNELFARYQTPVGYTRNKSGSD